MSGSWTASRDKQSEFGCGGKRVQEKVESAGAICLEEAEVVFKKNPAVEHPPVGDRVRN